jgi:hypothetical protein
MWGIVIRTRLSEPAGSLALVVALLAACVLAPTASAALWKPVVASCATLDGTAGACADMNDQFSGAWRIAVAPGGRHAYATAYNAGAVHVLDRDAATGALTARPGTAGCIAETGPPNCVDGKGLAQAGDIAISPDGLRIYVTGSTGTVAVFDRDATTGALTQKLGTAGCISASGSGGECQVGRAFGATGGMVLAPDGEHLYLAGADSIVVLDRDPTTGAISQPAATAGCVQETVTVGCADGRGLGFARQPAISPDGRHLYMPTGNGVAIFDRTPSSGELAQKAGPAGCITATGAPAGGCAADARMAGVAAVTLSPGGGQLYATANVAGGTITTFNVNADGTLTFASCINDLGDGGCSAGRHLSGLTSSAVSPDGEDLVAVSEGETVGGLTVLARDPASGALSSQPGPDGCVTATGQARDDGGLVAGGCRAHPAVSSIGGVTFATNEQLYAGFYQGSSIVALKRDFYPTCANTSAQAAYNSPVAVGLRCADRNADVVTLSIVQAPTAGLLGPIDQSQGLVLYSPRAGFRGSDVFRFRASAGGLDGPEATATLSVAGPGSASARLRTSISYRARAFRRFSRLTSLSARNGVPKGATIRMTCRGKGCPFKTKTIRQRKTAKTVSLTKHFGRTVGKGKRKRRIPAKLRPKVQIEVRVTAPRAIGRYRTITIRASKKPRSRAGCLAAGTSRKIAC